MPTKRKAKTEDIVVQEAAPAAEVTVAGFKGFDAAAERDRLKIELEKADDATRILAEGCDRYVALLATERARNAEMLAALKEAARLHANGKSTTAQTVIRAAIERAQSPDSKTGEA